MYTLYYHNTYYNISETINFLTPRVGITFVFGQSPRQSRKKTVITYAFTQEDFPPNLFDKTT